MQNKETGCPVFHETRQFVNSLKWLILLRGVPWVMDCTPTPPSKPSVVECIIIYYEETSFEKIFKKVVFLAYLNQGFIGFKPNQSNEKALCCVLSSCL